MKVSQLFNMLSLGELSNLSMANDGDGTIVPASQPKIINYANEALLRLYSRFVLKENDVLVQLHEHITFYHLKPIFAVNYIPESGEPNEPIRYILDRSQELFKDEVIKVLSIYDWLGQELPLNDPERHNSLFTPQAKLVQVPNPIDDTFINVHYQQRHKSLTGDLDQDIVCPDVLEGALTSYIAYKVFSHMNTAGSTVKAQEFMSIYEGICSEVTERDLVNSSVSQTNKRFARGGWI